MKRLLLLGFLWSTAAQAQAVEIGPALFYGSLAAGDLYSTHQAEGRGAHEANPIMRGQGTRYALKAAQVAGFSILDHKLKHRKKLRWGVRIVYAGITGGAIIHNSRQGR
jgi:hypothetical protein